MANKKQKFSFSKTSIIIFLIISIILTAFTFIFKTKIEEFLNSDNVSSVIDYNGLVMHTIDVGQAEAIMIKLPDGKNMLVDSGNKGVENNNRLKSYLDNNYFKDSVNKEIDYFVLTHSDSDHSGGAVMIFDSYKVNKVFRPNLFAENNAQESSLVVPYENKYYVTENKNWENTISKMYAENCEIEFSKAGIEIIESNYSIKFLAPTEYNYSNVNAYSPLILLEYKAKRIMLTGDITKEAEIKAINNLVDCDILNVAHHGSNTSTSEEFLEIVKPEYAVISSNNKGNNYHHPHQVVLNSLLEYMPEKNIYRTDTNGNIIINITTSGEIAVALDVMIASEKIKAEYILISSIGVLFVVCFSVNYTKKRKSK